MCIHGQWGSVCDRYFEEVDAKVVCRELGFPAESESENHDVVTDDVCKQVHINVHVPIKCGEES